MTTDRPSEQHLTPEETFGFIENTLSRGLRRTVLAHLDICPDCVEYLASVDVSQLSPDFKGESEEEVLVDSQARSPEEILQQLRPHIIATSPGGASGRGIVWVRTQWIPVVAAAAGLILAFALVQKLVIAPTRARQIATQTIADLVALRQETGRVPLRYIPGFHRARVTRSGFDTVNPAEEHIEIKLREAVELAPGELESQTALGLYLLDKGALEEAETRLQYVLDADPESSAAKNGLAVVYFELALRDSQTAPDFLRRGLTLLREAERQHPVDLQIAFNLGMFYQQLGFPDRARSSWSNYLKLDAESEWAEVARERLEDLGGS